MSNVKLVPLFDAQRKLDQRIIDEKNLDVNSIFSNTVLAFQTELGELANQWRGFKHWSSDQNPRVSGVRGDEPYNPMLDEFADGLHFVLSLGLQKGHENYATREYASEAWKRRVFRKEDVTNDQITRKVIRIMGLATDYHSYPVEHNYYPLMENYLDLGVMLGFSDEQVTLAYFYKNQVNHERQSSGY